MKFNPYIIDITHTTLHTLFWAKGMPYYERKTRLYEIEFITGGAGEMTTDGKKYKTARGYIFLRKPGIYTQGISGYYSYVVAFDPFYDDTKKKCYETTIPYWIYDVNTEIQDVGFFDNLPEYYHTDCYEKLCPLFDNIVNAFRENRELNQVYMKANLMKIMNAVEEENSGRKGIGEKRTIQNNYEQIIACKSYIDQHLDEKFTLDSLAEKCNLSKNFFGKIFKQIIGTAPVEYIIQNRMVLAKKLILTTDIQVEQISVLCGFEDKTYFYRQFKKYYGETPAGLRKNYCISENG